jgi:hypothetical protein
VHTVTKNFEKTGETAQSMAKTAQDSAYVVTDFVAKSQEVNTRFAQRVFESYSEVLRKQTELAQDMVQELYEKAEQQNDAFQKLYGQWTDAFGSFPVAGTTYDPFAVQRSGLRLAETATKNAQAATERVVEASTNGGFPISGYDELNVGEVGARLDSLTVAQLKKVREYEKRNKNRETVIDQIDRKIKAAS